MRIWAAVDLSGLRLLDGAGENRDEGTQKRGEPAGRQGEGVAGGWRGEPLIRSGSRALEVIAIHAMLGLDVADDRLDGGAALHPRRKARPVGYPTQYTYCTI